MDIINMAIYKVLLFKIEYYITKKTPFKLILTDY